MDEKSYLIRVSRINGIKSDPFAGKTAHEQK